MPRFKLFIEYDGTRYSGWQVQKNARTIQGELIEAARAMFGTVDMDLQGSGRTDAGVHALTQVAHLEVATMLAPEIIRMKFNDALPADINLLEVEKAPKSFHARHDAVARAYLYQISHRRTAFGKRYVWWIKDALDAARMRSAAVLFTGMKDLRSFTADDPEEKSTKVAIESITLREEGELLLIRIVGSHFLWKLVRQIVGILVEVGRGKADVRLVASLMRSESNEAARHTAPPSGLFLESVYYAGDEQSTDVRPALEVALSRRVFRKK